MAGPDQTDDLQPSQISLVFVGLICVATGGLYFVTASVKPPLWSLVLFCNLFILTLYDWRTYRLPNLFTGVFFLCAAAYVFAAPYWPVSFHLIGALVGVLFFPLLNGIYKKLRGRDGVGMGDAKLLACLGLWLGWPALPAVLFVASMGGIVYALLNSVAQKRITHTTRLPFGPFLCLGGWISWLFL